MSFRLPESEQAYREYSAKKAPDAPCPLCSEGAIIEFTYWRIIKNNYPYDRIALVHDMIVPKRHAQEG